MLAIRLQRQGRKGYPTYRVAVQESQRHPSSGRVVTYVGNYNPHTKTANFDTEKVLFYLGHGAQPTPRVVKLLSEQKVKLPDWVEKKAAKKDRSIKHPEKLRRNRPAEEAPTEAKEETPVAETVEEAPAEEQVVEAEAEPAVEETEAEVTDETSEAEAADTPDTEKK